MYTIAVHPDISGPNENSDRFAPHWIDYLAAHSCKIKIVNAYSTDIIESLRGCHGFMWRWFHGGQDALVARRLFPVVEKYLNIPCYPNLNTCWHYDDKAAQMYLFQALGIPHPKTWLFTQREMAEEWVQTQAHFPQVLKLATGAGSTGVVLVENKACALQWIHRFFCRGVIDLNPEDSLPIRCKRAIKNFYRTLFSGWPDRLDGSEKIHHNYILFQEFLPKNKWDTRVTVIGNRAFAFRRYNKDNDFRASGSGKIDYGRDGIDYRFVLLAFDVAKKLGTQSVAIDGLWKGQSPVVGEISYTYAHHPVYNCPGHWEQDALDYSQLYWKEGHLWPGTAQAEDFLRYLSND